MKPRLFLDVDGVLNGDEVNDRWNDWTLSRVGGMRVCWSPTVAAFLSDLSQQAEILWLTTWEHEAHRFLAPLMGLPLWQVAGERFMLPSEGDWWKATIVQATWERDPRPFVWLDDELSDADRFPTRKWLAGLPAGEVLAIGPRYSRGLLPQHLPLIQDFVDEKSAL